MNTRKKSNYISIMHEKKDNLNFTFQNLHCIINTYIFFSIHSNRNFLVDL